MRTLSPAGSAISTRRNFIVESAQLGRIFWYNLGVLRVTAWQLDLFHTPGRRMAWDRRHAKTEDLPSCWGYCKKSSNPWTTQLQRKTKLSSYTSDWTECRKEPQTTYQINCFCPFLRGIITPRFTPKPFLREWFNWHLMDHVIGQILFSREDRTQQSEVLGE